MRFFEFIFLQRERDPFHPFSLDASLDVEQFEDISSPS